MENMENYDKPIVLSTNIFKIEYEPNEYGETIQLTDNSIISISSPSLSFAYDNDGKLIDYKWNDITLTIKDTLESNRQKIMEMFREYTLKPGGQPVSIPGKGSKISFKVYYYTKDNDKDAVSCVKVVNAKPVEVSFGGVNKHDKTDGIIIFTIRPQYCVLVY